jgi:toxin-antitoxin system PIN domain toxin
VIVPDANLLLYAYDSLSPQHEPARHWLEGVLSSRELVGMPWQTVSAFVRVVTNVRLFKRPRTIEEVVQLIEFWLQQPNVRPLSPGDQHWPIFRELLIKGQVTGPLATDAQLAALTLEHGGVLYTADRDFARFPGLRWVNPLEGAQV